MTSEYLFSYGTLQYESVQLMNFGRTLKGYPDVLPGFKLTMIEIIDPKVIAASGEMIHPIITSTGEPDDQVLGMVYEVTKDELDKADAYEISDYKRIQVTLTSGCKAWVYVNTLSAIP